MSIFSTPSQIQLFPHFLQTLLLGIYTCLSISRWLDLSYSHSGQVPSSTYLCATLMCLPNNSVSLRFCSHHSVPLSVISEQFINFHYFYQPLDHYAWKSKYFYSDSFAWSVCVCQQEQSHQDAEHPSLWMAEEGRARTFSLSLIPKDFSRCQGWDAQRTREAPPSPIAA